jgi:isoprenylcysteine carboxyl methyltransferase (ICMT) family protein YpbQ
MNLQTPQKAGHICLAPWRWLLRFSYHNSHHQNYTINCAPYRSIPILLLHATMVLFLVLPWYVFGYYPFQFRVFLFYFL